MIEKTGVRPHPRGLAPWLRPPPGVMPDARPLLLTPHVLGFLIVLLTIVPAYLVSRASVPSDAREIEHQAPDNDDVIEEPRSEFLAVAIEAHIREVAVRYHIAPILVAAIVEAESDFNPRAVSRRGARGLMQLMPATAAAVQVEDTFDPYENIEGGVRHLRGLMDRFNGDLPQVLAAYNAGEQAVLLYGGVPPFGETRRYVARILRRIGRDDLVGRVNRRAIIAAPTSRSLPGLALAMTTGARAGWRERQVLERQAVALMDTMDVMDPGARDGAGGEPPMLEPVTNRPAAPAARIQGP
jgi:transglycosylase-like protein with SLT domain